MFAHDRSDSFNWQEVHKKFNKIGVEKNSFLRPKFKTKQLKRLHFFTGVPFSTPDSSDPAMRSIRPIAVMGKHMDCQVPVMAERSGAGRAVVVVKSVAKRAPLPVFCQLPCEAELGVRRDEVWLPTPEALAVIIIIFEVCLLANILLV